MGWAKSMPFASINPTNPRTNPWNFHEKILRIGGAGKWGFFEAAILNFLSRPFWIFFCFISVKNPALLYEVSFFSALWMVFPESWKRSCPNFYAHDCTIQHLKNQITSVLKKQDWKDFQCHRLINDKKHDASSLGWLRLCTVLSNWKIDGRHKIFWLFRSKSL